MNLPKLNPAPAWSHPTGYHEPGLVYLHAGGWVADCRYCDDILPVHYCCGEYCPGYQYPASERPHPVTCITGPDPEEEE